MKEKEFNALVADTVLDIMSRLNTKNPEYSPGEDKLLHFKAAGKKRNKTPEACLLGMQLKHSIHIDFIVERISKGILAAPEVWKEKVIDRIAYDVLLLALVKEREDKGGCVS
jgi:hypothetical protein